MMYDVCNTFPLPMRRFFAARQSVKFSQNTPYSLDGDVKKTEFL